MVSLKGIGNGLKKAGKFVYDVHAEPVKFIHNNVVMPTARGARELHDTLPHPQVSVGYPAGARYGGAYGHGAHRMNWIPFDPYTNTPAHFGMETMRERGHREGFGQAMDMFAMQGGFGQSRFMPGSAGNPIIIQQAPMMDPGAQAALGIAQQPAAPAAPEETEEARLHRLKMSAFKQAGYTHFDMKVQDGNDPPGDYMLKDGKRFRVDGPVSGMPADARENFNDLLKVSKRAGADGPAAQPFEVEGLSGDMKGFGALIAFILKDPQLRQVLDNLTEVARIKKDMQDNPKTAPTEEAKADAKKEASITGEKHDSKPPAKKPAAAAAAPAG